MRSPRLARRQLDEFPRSFTHRTSSLSVQDLRIRSPDLRERSYTHHPENIRSHRPHDNRSDISSRSSDPDRTLVDQPMKPRRASGEDAPKSSLAMRLSGKSPLTKQNSFDMRSRLGSDKSDFSRDMKSRSFDNLHSPPSSTTSSGRKCLTPRSDHIAPRSDHVTRADVVKRISAGRERSPARRDSSPSRRSDILRPGSDCSDVFESAPARPDSAANMRKDSDTRSVASERSRDIASERSRGVMKPAVSPRPHRASPRPARTSPGLGGKRASPRETALSSFVWVTVSYDHDCTRMCHTISRMCYLILSGPGFCGYNFAYMILCSPRCRQMLKIMSWS